MRGLTIIQALLIFVLVLAIAGGSFAYFVYNDVHVRRHHTVLAPFVVSPGESLEHTINHLADIGIIQTTWPIKIYIKCSASKPVIKAGRYQLPSPISPVEAIQFLEQGEDGNLSRFTIIEGWTRFEIASAMQRFPSFHLNNQAQALGALGDVKLIKDLDPTAKTLEGYLFPDTYFIPPDAHPRLVAIDAVHRFKQIWNNKLKLKAMFTGKSVHEIVTIASIIETEAKLKSERAIIASVIENRLKRRMPLSMDSTIVYASKLAGAWKGNGIVYMSDVKRNSPYNTRIYQGLPPGPVGSPGLSSLEAAISPASTNYLFYVRNPDRNDGAHNFYSDAAGFESGVQALRKWEQQHRPQVNKRTK